MCATAEVTLENSFVRLEPLRVEHADDLARLTAGKGLTQWFPQPLETQTLVDQFVAFALDEKAKGLALPFVIVEPASGAIIGSTRFGAITPTQRRAEIGWTFIGRPWQRSAINTAAKLLLLEHGFERMNCVRIELKTDARNETSRAAILRIVAIEEGTLRKHIKRADGTYRDTVYFSIIDTEWPQVKARLKARLNLD